MQIDIVFFNQKQLVQNIQSMKPTSNKNIFLKNGNKAKFRFKIFKAHKTFFVQVFACRSLNKKPFHVKNSISEKQLIRYITEYIHEMKAVSKK